MQPGVVNDDLRAAVAEHGLWYPPDPASSPWSTIGGNVATNAGGICCVKYGVTRDYVLALEMVTGRRRAGPPWASHRQGGGWVRPSEPSGRVGGNTRHRHRGDLRLRPSAAGDHRAGYLSGCEAGVASAPWQRPALTPSAFERVDRIASGRRRWKNMGLQADARSCCLARVDEPAGAGGRCL